MASSLVQKTTLRSNLVTFGPGRKRVAQLLRLSMPPVGTDECMRAVISSLVVHLGHFFLASTRILSSSDAENDSQQQRCDLWTRQEADSEASAVVYAPGGCGRVRQSSCLTISPAGTAVTRAFAVPARSVAAMRLRRLCSGVSSRSVRPCRARALALRRWRRPAPTGMDLATELVGAVCACRGKRKRW
eukprot:COSAG06_NODE_4204_length_4480_cov_3.149509_5_plen_188_part_00